MSNNLKSYLAVSAIVCALILAIDTSAFSQCGTYFKSNYGAVNKIAPSPFTGRNYELADWTGDGRSDFWNLRTVGLSDQREIRIFPALPSGYWNWDAPIVYTINIPAAQFPSVSGQVIRDFDSDGRIDMLINAGGSSGTLILLRNAGDGTLQPGVASPNFPTAGAFAFPIGWADVNSDGRVDRIYTQVNSSNFSEVISYSLLNADGSFGSPVSVLAHAPDNGVNNSPKSVGDFDGDGKLDIAFFGLVGSDRQLRVLKNLGNGSFMLGNAMPATATGIDVADLNIDGRADIVGRGNGAYVIYSGQTDGTFTSATYPALNGQSGVPNLRIADFSGDGRLDLINVRTQDYEVFINNPAGGFTTSFYPRRLRTDSLVAYQFEDFSGDSKADMIDLSHNTKNVFGEEVVTVQANVCEPRGHTRGLNFDSNGPLDFALWNPSSGEWKSVNGDWPSTGVITTKSFMWGASGDVPAPGDFDGDGLTDYAVYRNSEGNWYVYQSGTASWLVFRFGLPGDIPIPNDYNDGGKTDFAVFRPSEGNWYIWHTEAGTFTALHWGSDGDRPVPADFDGDGKTDIAVFRPSTSDWYYIKSSDQSFGIVHWGTTGDVALPADYDGDRRADLTVFRSGVWHILRSSNNAYHLYAWGTAGDVPVPLLEAGEIAWPAVFRPSNSRWYHPRYFFGVVTTPGAGTPIQAGLPNN